MTTFNWEVASAINEKQESVGFTESKIVVNQLGQIVSTTPPPTQNTIGTNWQVSNEI
jgi:hypothetical protein